jgi:hypothetical protein
MNASPFLKKTLDDFSMYAGENIIVMGSGPSLFNFNFDYLKNKNVIAVNNAVKYCNPFALVSIDSFFVEHELKLKTNQEEYFQKQNYKSFFFHTVKVYPDQYQDKIVKLSHSSFPKETDLKNGKLYAQDLSGLMGVHLAICLKAKNIFLLGFDCKVNSMTHFSDNEIPHRWKNGKSGENYLKKAEKFHMFNPWRTKIFNVCLDSAITSFPKISFSEFYERCDM